MKKLFLSLFLFCFCASNCFGNTPIDSTLNLYVKYKQEIKELFEDHYGSEFTATSTLDNSCIDWVKRKIDKQEGTTYGDCNYFVSRRFKKEAFQSNEGISKEDILFADFRLEFVENILNNTDFEMTIADKIHVEIGDYKDYVYVVVGVTSSWYEKNTDY